MFVACCRSNSNPPPEASSSSSSILMSPNSSKFQSTKPPKQSTVKNPVLCDTIMETHDPTPKQVTLPEAGEKDKVEGFEVHLDFDVRAAGAPDDEGGEGDEDEHSVDEGTDEENPEPPMDEGTDYPDDAPVMPWDHRRLEDDDVEDVFDDEGMGDSGSSDDESDPALHPGPSPFMMLYNALQNLTSSHTSAVFSAFVNNKEVPPIPSSDDMHKSRYLGLGNIIAIYVPTLLEKYGSASTDMRDVNARINYLIISFDYGVPVTLTKVLMRKLSEILFCVVTERKPIGEGREADELRGLVNTARTWWTLPGE